MGGECFFQFQYCTTHQIYHILQSPKNGGLSSSRSCALYSDACIGDGKDMTPDDTPQYIKNTRRKPA